MPFYHSDPSREPDVEVLYDPAGNSDLEGSVWYWTHKGEYSGPYPTEAEALAAARAAVKDTQPAKQTGKSLSALQDVHDAIKEN